MIENKPDDSLNIKQVPSLLNCDFSKQLDNLLILPLYEQENKYKNINFQKADYNKQINNSKIHKEEIYKPNSASKGEDKKTKIDFQNNSYMEPKINKVKNKSNNLFSNGKNLYLENIDTHEIFSDKEVDVRDRINYNIEIIKNNKIDNIIIHTKIINCTKKMKNNEKNNESLSEDSYEHLYFDKNNSNINKNDPEKNLLLKQESLVFNEDLIDNSLKDLISTSKYKKNVDFNDILNESGKSEDSLNNRNKSHKLENKMPKKKYIQLKNPYKIDRKDKSYEKNVKFLYFHMQNIKIQFNYIFLKYSRSYFFIYFLF